MRFWCRCLGNGPFPCRINTARVKPTAQHPVKCYNFGKELLLPMFFIFLPASFSPPNSQKRSQWKMLFQIIEISKNFSKSPQGMLPGHIFLSHGMGMSPLAMEGGWWGHWGNIPGEHPRAASLPFPLHLVASGVIPSTPSKSICCRASPSQLPQQIGEFLGFFFPLWMLGFPCCLNEPLPQPALAGRREADKGFAHTSSSAWLQRGEVFLSKDCWFGSIIPLLLPLKYCWN